MLHPTAGPTTGCFHEKFFRASSATHTVQHVCTNKSEAFWTDAFTTGTKKHGKLMA